MKNIRFICCLSSLNLAKYDEWKDTDVVETAVRFLDGVMQEFIDKSNGQGFNDSYS
jgi:ribonucleoside-diphosphate reductase alpha chain